MSVDVSTEIEIGRLLPRLASHYTYEVEEIMLASTEEVERFLDTLAR